MIPNKATFKGIESLSQNLIVIPLSLQSNIVELRYNSVRSNKPGLNDQRLPPSGCKHIGIRQFRFVAKTKFSLGDCSLIVILGGRDIENEFVKSLRLQKIRVNSVCILLDPELKFKRRKNFST